MLKNILTIILDFLLVILVAIALQQLFNGGAEIYSAQMKNLGFFEFIKWFFTSLWEGFKNTIGI